jgi:hypothetical protein
MSTPNRNLGEKLQSLPKPALFTVLFVLTTIPLFVTVPVPNNPAEPSLRFYDFVKKLPPDKPVLISSDWTNSTRGESAGEFKALMRMLMRQKIKFCIYSMGDVQAPGVASDAIRMVNDERKKEGDPEYKRWEDWVSAGYSPGAEVTSNAIENNFKTAFESRKDKNTAGVPTPIFESPVLANVRRVKDFSAMIIVTGSKTSNIAIERVKSTSLIMMVTGVMGPESQVYYDSGQVKGLVSGLKGLYDIEEEMAKDPTSKGKTTKDNGAKYYPTLHIALTLLILAVIIGNLGMFLAKRRTA